MTVRLKRLDNIDVVCTDVDALVAFYGGLLGLELRLPYERGQGWAGFRAGDVVIYFIEEEGAGEHPAPRFTGASNPPGIDSFAFEVDSLDDAIAELDGQVPWAGEIVRRSGTATAACTIPRATSSTSPSRSSTGDRLRRPTRSCRTRRSSSRISTTTGARCSSTTQFSGLDRPGPPAEPGNVARPTSRPWTARRPGRRCARCRRRCSTRWDRDGDPELRLRRRLAPQPGRRGGARGGGQRLAGRRVARAGAAPARLDRRAHRQPAMAAREIDRVGGHPGFVQVLPAGALGDAVRQPRLYPPSSRRPRGTTWSSASTSAARPGNPPTASGWPSYYIEEYVGMAQVFQSQLMNLVVEGVFDRFPTCAWRCVESGFTWLPAFMWRIDKEWQGLRREVPWAAGAVGVHPRARRVTLQPLDAPPDAASCSSRRPARLGRAADVLDRLPALALRPADEALLRRAARARGQILAENARAFYRLGDVVIR